MSRLYDVSGLISLLGSTSFCLASLNLLWSCLSSDFLCSSGLDTRHFVFDFLLLSVNFLRLFDSGVSRCDNLVGSNFLDTGGHILFGH